MLHARTILIALLTIGILSSFASESAAQARSEDEKALATYRLTMPNVRKLMAVMQSFADEVARDPKVQEMARLTKQIEPLLAKDELTAAEQALQDKLQERIDALEREADEKDAKDDGSSANNAKSLADMEAAIKKHPAAMSALAREGLSPRDYALTTMALLQASMIEGFSQGKVDMKNLPPGVNPDNILFVREHKVELEAMQKAMAGKK
ncbi:MAG: hypothetical protein M3541_18110 [Acidobacteriota bacterium]|nr:hypothetical protein [Acidobacteriota bacterium]